MSLYPTQVLRTRTTRGRVLFDGLYDLWSRFEETIAAVPWPFGANLAKATILKYVRLPCLYVLRHNLRYPKGTC